MINTIGKTYINAEIGKKEKNCIQLPTWYKIMGVGQNPKQNQ